MLINGNIIFKQNCMVMHNDVIVGGSVIIENNMNARNLNTGGQVTVENKGAVEGNIQAVGDVIVKNNAVVTGDIRSMGNITLEQNAVVGGDVWANGVVNNSSSKKEGIYPNQSMDLRFTVHPFPEIDLDWYHKNADYYYSGSQTWSGDLNLNGLFYIDGNLKIQGTYSGVGTVVVSGTVTIGGNLKCTDIEQDDLCILCAGNVMLDNKAEVRALIYSPATVTIDNGATLSGSVIARTLIQNNNSQFHYVPEMENNQPDWVTTSLQIISWEEK